MGGTPEEISWASRKLFETLARERPLIIGVDDIQWAEPTLLDLLEYLVTFTSDAPILLLCLARADLFDERPSWSNPRPNARLLTLAPLSEDDSSALIERLPRERALSEDNGRASSRRRKATRSSSSSCSRCTRRVATASANS